MARARKSSVPAHPFTTDDTTDDYANVLGFFEQMAAADRATARRARARAAVRGQTESAEV